MVTSAVPSTEPCACHEECAATRERSVAVGRALQLEYLTVTWNLVEGLVAVAAALAAGSVAILGFGIDSFVECLSAFVLIWRLRAERHSRASPKQLDTLEHRARKLVAASLFVLAAYIAFDAVHTLWSAERPAFSTIGVILLAISLGVMRWLASAKRSLARQIGSEALEADAFQTTACWWLSLAALVGVGLNGALGWWWADPLAALVIAALVVTEGRDAWRGRTCC